MDLDKLQGNILKSHGRDNAVLLLLRFKTSADAVRRWMAAFARKHLTTARQQQEHSMLFHETGNDGGTVHGNLFISAAGYGQLHLNPALLETGNTAGASFSGGLEGAGPALNDPSRAAWEPTYQPPIHALVLLAADDEANLLQRMVQVLQEALEVADLAAIEIGKSQFSAGQRVEHFGYADGLTNPEPAEAAQPGSPKPWDPAAGLDLVLAKDVLAPSGSEAFGSFLVYRKLEQNVKKFRMLVGGLAALPGQGPVLAGAMAVGRFPDGSPVVLGEVPQGPRNDFDYSSDPRGERCPFHAHIRKMNPRGTSDSPAVKPLKGERLHRIVRRGITYGQRAADLSDEPESGVGLLFLCFQSNISQQFAFLQKMWAADAAFPQGAGTGVDPLTGPGAAQPQQWPEGWGATTRAPFAFGNVVTLKGGEFFFAPSLPFLLAGA